MLLRAFERHLLSQPLFLHSSSRIALTPLLQTTLLLHSSRCRLLLLLCMTRQSRRLSSTTPTAPIVLTCPPPSSPPSSPASQVSHSIQWHSLGVSAAELRCAVTLTNGQCFAWRKHPSRLEWTGVVGQLVLSLRESEDDTLFAVHHPAAYCVSAVVAMLRDYFFLDRARLVELYAEWSADDRFASVAARLAGMRLLRQEPLECLVSFICSSCNNIARITQMTGALRRKYGQWLCDTTVGREEEDGEEDGQQVQGRGKQSDDRDGEQSAVVESWYAFPSLSQLAVIPSSELRSLGFGYRAEYVTDTARELQQRGGVDWLTGWRSPDVTTDAVVAALQELAGVGPKVAACVALFSLDRLDLIPVDTHVHQIALRDYGRLLSAEVRRSKSVTKRVHASIAALFRDKFGPMAGWAHSVLFTAELPAFRHLLTQALDGSESSSSSNRTRQAAIAVQPVAKKESKRRRGAQNDAECTLDGEIATKVEAVQSMSGVTLAEHLDHSNGVKVEMVVNVETIELAGKQAETLNFPAVKRARIPKKTSIVVKRTQLGMISK